MKKYIVALTEEERQMFMTLTSNGQHKTTPSLFDA
jgi:hypothetical protein